MLDGGLVVQALNDDADISGFDIALFSAGGGTSKEWAPRFVEAGATVIDNSSAFRRDPDVPLVVSEVNPHALRGISDQRRHPKLIANPNCSTMQLMVALAPIHREAGIERLVVATYQSVSGTGQRALDELDAQARADLTGTQVPAPSVYPDTIAFNVIGAAGNFVDGDDHTDEERKMMFETRKILEDESIGVTVTCVRVPVRDLTLGGGQHPDARAADRGAGAGAARRGARGDRRERPVAVARRRSRRGVRRADPRRRLAPAGAVDVRRRRQPAQGRGDQRRPDRRAADP